MNSIEAVIFDLEGVIIDSEQHVWDKVAEIFLGRRGFTYDREIIKPLIMGRTLEEGIKIWQQFYGFGGKIKELAQERREIAGELFEEEIPFIPGFIDFYGSIQKKYKTAIATSLEREFLHSLDKRINLSDMFAGHIYSIADIGYISKPNPAIYLYAAKRLGILPVHCIGVEDAPNGIEALRRAGMRSIAITTSTSKENLAASDLTVNFFAEINLANF